MYLFKRISDLKRHLEGVRSGSRTLGFVPTMGALHAGHLSLIERSRKDNQITVCSIFVNPTQFNQPSDLEQYPRTPAKDIEWLHRVGTEVLFMPEEQEIYPADAPPAPALDFGLLDQVMEGRYRPGHFAGVAQVVHRLLTIVGPDRLYLGLKDYQQFCIIDAMIRQLGLKVKLTGCPIVREADGLAMSSRNVRLLPEHRRQAGIIYQTLEAARAMAPDHPPSEIRRYALAQLSREGFRPEYFEIVDGQTLQPVTSFAAPGKIMACTAVWAGEVRLIDNMELREA